MAFQSEPGDRVVGEYLPWLTLICAAIPGSGYINTEPPAGASASIETGSVMSDGRVRAPVVSQISLERAWQREIFCNYPAFNM